MMRKLAQLADNVTEANPDYERLYLVGSNLSASTILPAAAALLQRCTAKLKHVGLTSSHSSHVWTAVWHAS